MPAKAVGRAHICLWADAALLTMKPQMPVMMPKSGLALSLTLTLFAPLAAQGLDTVVPTAATADMLGSGDVADDLCVWLHPGDRTRSVILGVNKSDKTHGGLYAFQLDGARWKQTPRWEKEVNWFAAGKKLNNVDVRHGIASGAEKWDIVCAANRTDRALDLFRVRANANGDFERLELAARVPIGRGFAAGTDAPYGLALFHPKGSRRSFAVTSDKLGRVAQYELLCHPAGLDAEQITARRFDDHGRPWPISERRCEIEGIVADDERAVIYLGSEDEGIFRFRTQDGVLDPGTKVVVDRVGPRLKADVEGLTLYLGPDGTGYLIASSQGSDRFVVYQRAFSGDQPNAYVTSFAIGAGQGIDAVTATDGIDAVCADFGGQFQDGIFIAHDGEGHSPSNYKLVAWANIARVIEKARPPAR